MGEGKHIDTVQDVLEALATLRGEMESLTARVNRIDEKIIRLARLRVKQLQEESEFTTNEIEQLRPLLQKSSSVKSH